MVAGYRSLDLEYVSMPDVISGLGQSGTGSATTTPAVALSLSTVNRSGVLLCNTDSSKRLYVVLSSDFSNAPTISSTVHDFAVPPLTTLQIGVGRAVAIWIASESSTVAYAIKEVQF